MKIESGYLQYLQQGWKALSEKSISLDHYDILENELEEIMIVVPKPIGGSIQEAVFFYDGGEHGLLFKGRTALAICDHIHPGVRKSLSEKKEILICETENGVAVQDAEYMVPLIYYPHASAIAEKLLKD